MIQPCQNQKSTVTAIVGPNGSGKSTITDGLREHHFIPGEYINADEIVVSKNVSNEEAALIDPTLSRWTKKTQGFLVQS